MKTYLLAAVACAALSGASAMAADLPESVIEAVAVPSFSWTGAYVGAQGGYGFGKSKIKDNFSFRPKTDPDGFFLGGKVAGLYQFNQFVIGAEGELNYSWMHDTKNTRAGFDPNRVRTNFDWFGSVSGKAGAAFDRVLVYGTGGVAFARISTGQSIPVLGEEFQKKQTYVGFTVGGGVDYAVTDNIVAGVQYRYYDFGSEKFKGPANFTDRKQSVTAHTVAASVSYKF